MPESTIDFLERMLEDFTFRIHCIQTDNSMEFTSQKLLFEKKHPLDIFCKKKNIKREFIVRYKVPMGLIPLVCSMTQSDRVVESTHHITANKK